MTPTGGVLQPQTVDRIIEEEGGVGVEIEQLTHHDPFLLQLLAAFAEGLLGGRTEGEMECARRYPQATVDARVVGRRHPGDLDPLHEGQGAIAPAVKEQVLHPAPLSHQQLLMDDHAKAQLTFIETASGRQVVGAKTEMVEGHRS